MGNLDPYLGTDTVQAVGEALAQAQKVLNITALRSLVAVFDGHQVIVDGAVYRADYASVEPESLPNVVIANDGRRWVLRSCPNVVLQDDGSDFLLCDEAGRVAVKVKENGDAEFVAVVAGSTRVDGAGVSAESVSVGGVESTEVAGVSQVVTDQNGLAGLKVSSAGIVETSKAYLKNQFRGDWDRTGGDFGAEINHILCYGQSWALGFDSQPAVSTVQKHNTLMFNGGVRQLQSVAENPAALQSFVSAVESNNIGSPEFPTGVLGETGAVAMTEVICDLIQSENNISYSQHGHQFLVSVPGEGSKSLEELADNGLPFMQRLKEQIARGYAVAQSLGKTYRCTAVTWMQGSGTGGGVTYAADLEAMRADISAYAQSVTGQDEEVKLITWQLMPQNNTQSDQRSATGVYTRFVVAADTYPHIVCAGPAYQHIMNSSTNVHIKAQSSRMMGMAFGVAYKRTIIDGQKFVPLKPVSLYRQGSIALLELNVDDGYVVFDTETQLQKPNYGFGLFDSGGTAITINSVSIVGRNKIKITAATTIPSGATLRYAYSGTDYMEANKWAGNVRDNSHHATGVSRWLVAFGIGFDN